MAKQQKMLTFDPEIIEHLKIAKPNASQYVQELVYADIKREIDKKKVETVDMNKSYQELEVQASEQAKKDAEKKERQAAWDSMPKLLKDEIMSYNNWGEKWRVIFYPIYKKNGTITAKEFSEVV